MMTQYGDKKGDEVLAKALEAREKRARRINYKLLLRARIRAIRAN